MKNCGNAVLDYLARKILAELPTIRTVDALAMKLDSAIFYLRTTGLDDPSFVRALLRCLEPEILPYVATLAKNMDRIASDPRFRDLALYRSAILAMARKAEEEGVSPMDLELTRAPTFVVEKQFLLTVRGGVSSSEFLEMVTEWAERAEQSPKRARDQLNQEPTTGEAAERSEVAEERSEQRREGRYALWLIIGAAAVATALWLYILLHP